MEPFKEVLALAIGLAMVLCWERQRRRRDRRERIIRNLRLILGASREWADNGSSGAAEGTISSSV